MNQQSKPAWYDAAIKYLPALLIIGGGFTSFILTWNEVKLLRQDYNKLNEQVQRQYGTQREMNSKTNEELKEVQLWIKFQEGKQAAIQWMQDNQRQIEK